MLKKKIMNACLLTSLSLSLLAPAVGRADNDMFRPDLSKWERKSVVKGGKLEVMRGERAGIPIKNMPVKLIKGEELKKSDFSKMKSGLYLVDLDYIPHFVKEALQEYKLTLRPDGSLVDAQGQEAKIFMTGETGLVRASIVSPRDRIDSSLDLDNLLMDRHGATLDHASPYPFLCYSFYPWAVYYGGFHRWYDARTYAATYTTDPAGNCSILSPQTRIEYLQTYVVVSGDPGVNTCTNCNASNSRDVWDVGYFWPAHGGASTYHHAVYKDGSIYFSRTANLGW